MDPALAVWRIRSYSSNNSPYLAVLQSYHILPILKPTWWIICIGLAFPAVSFSSLLACRKELIFIVVPFSFFLTKFHVYICSYSKPSIEWPLFWLLSLTWNSYWLFHLSFLCNIWPIYMEIIDVYSFYCISCFCGVLEFLPLPYSPCFHLSWIVFPSYLDKMIFFPFGPKILIHMLHTEVVNLLIWLILWYSTLSFLSRWCYIVPLTAFLQACFWYVCQADAFMRSDMPVLLSYFLAMHKCSAFLPLSPW